MKIVYPSGAVGVHIPYQYSDFKTKEGKSISALSKDVLIKISEGNWKADNFDLGRGEPIKIIDLALNICNGEEDNIKFVPLRKNEGQHTKADIEFTFKRINWKAQKDLIYYITLTRIA